MLGLSLRALGLLLCAMDSHSRAIHPTAGALLAGGGGRVEKGLVPAGCRLGLAVSRLTV